MHVRMRAVIARTPDACVHDTHTHRLKINAVLKRRLNTSNVQSIVNDPLPAIQIQSAIGPYAPQSCQVATTAPAPKAYPLLAGSPTIYRALPEITNSIVGLLPFPNWKYIPRSFSGLEILSPNCLFFPVIQV